MLNQLKALADAQGNPQADLIHVCAETDFRQLHDRMKAMEEALRKIANWELPETGKFYPNTDGSISNRPIPYDSVYANGSIGGQNAVMSIARKALGETT